MKNEYLKERPSKTNIKFVKYTKIRIDVKSEEVKKGEYIRVLAVL